MKVYLIEFYSGGTYEDFNSWIDDVVYLDKKDCVDFLKHRGYVETTTKVAGEIKTYWYKSKVKDDPYTRRINAEIYELEVIE